MAKGITSGGGLRYKAQLDINEALKNAQKLKTELSGMGIGMAKSFDVKPLTAYQAEQLKIKQQAIEVAKQKQEQAAAEKSASLVLQDALKQERLAREAINTQIAANRLAQQQANQVAKEQLDLVRQAANQKRPTQVSNSPAEIAKYNAGTFGTNGQVNTAFTAYLREVKKDFDAGKISAQQYVAELERYSAVVVGNVNVTKTQASANKQTSLSKRELAEAAAMEALKEKEATAALKNHAREMSNAKGSLEQRRAALIRLTAAYDRLSQVERNTAAGMRLGTIVKGLSQQIGELELATNRGQRSVGQYGGAFTQLKEQLLGAVTGYLSLYAVINAGKAIFENNVHLSDDFTDVQRTAKLSGEEVDRLGDKLKGLNTRTSLGNLLDIGFEGGRLGVQKDEIFDYIKTVDQLAVVLKKELPGGAQAISESLGKISKIYRIAEREGITLAEAMNKVGSSQLELAHDGGVTVKYLQDFSLGLAGTAVTAKLALPVIEGYGAVLSNSGQIASSASLALTRVVNDLSVKREKYFAIAQLADANLTLKEFTNLINNDTKGALDLFFKGLKAGNPVQTELADRLNSVGLKTGKVSNAVKVLAENQELLNTKIGIASKAYDEGTSVAHNFELANNSLAASLEKIKNAIVNAFTDSSFSRSLAEMLNAITDTRTESEKLAAEYENQKHATDELEKKMNPLLKRYDELTLKTNLTTGEQDELKRVTTQIGELLPGVTTKFDKYGNAIAISRDRILELTKAQRDLLLATNRDAIKKANDEFIENQRMASLQRLNVEESAALVGKNLGLRRGSNEDVQKADDYLKILQGRAYEAAKAIRDLGGTLSKSQQEVINYYEVVKKPTKKKDPKAEILGTGEIVDDTLNTDRTPEVMKAEIKALTAANLKLKKGSKELADGVAKLKALKKELKLTLGGKDTEAISSENQLQSAVKSRNSLQSEIDALTKKGRAKQLSDDAQELSDVDAKYQKLREKAIAFNKDKKNKGLKVDAGGLLVAQSAEEDAVRDKQSTEKLKVSLTEQKKLYEDYEAYKTKIGSTEASKRFASEIDTEKTYLQSLIDQRDNLLNPQKSKGAEGDGVVNAQQVKFLEEQIAIEKQLQRKKDDEIYANAYQAAQTFQQKLVEIDIDYNQKRKALGENATADQLANLNHEREEKIRSANSENAYRLSGTEKLLENIDSMTRKKAIEGLNKAIAVYREQYSKGLISAKEYYDRVAELEGNLDSLNRNNIFNSIEKAIARYKRAKKEFEAATDPDSKKDKTIAFEKAQTNLYDQISSGASEATNVINDLASSLSELGIGGEDLQSVFKNVTGILDGAGSIAKGIASGNPVDIVTGSIKLLTSAINLFNTKDKKIEKQIKAYKDQLASLGNSYKQLERDVQNSVGESIYTDQASQIENLRQQQVLLTKARDAERNKKKSDQGKIDEFQSQIDSIPGQIEDIQKAISQNLIQTTFKDISNSLADAFTEAFQAGEDGIEKMDDVFNNFIANAIKNSLKLKLIEPIIAQMTKDLTTYAQGHENSIVGFDFTSYKAAIAKAQGEFVSVLDANKEFFKNIDSKDTNSSTGISRTQLTEETGQRIDGIMRAQYDATKLTNVLLTPIGKSIGDMYQIAKSNFDVQMKIEANTFRTANNTDLLNNKLDAIIANTKPTITPRGAGI